MSKGDAAHAAEHKHGVQTRETGTTGNPITEARITALEARVAKLEAQVPPVVSSINAPESQIEA